MKIHSKNLSSYHEEVVNLERHMKDNIGLFKCAEFSTHLKQKEVLIHATFKKWDSVYSPVFEKMQISNSIEIRPENKRPLKALKINE